MKERYCFMNKLTQSDKDEAEILVIEKFLGFLFFLIKWNIIGAILGEYLIK